MAKQSNYKYVIDNDLFNLEDEMWRVDTGTNSCWLWTGRITHGEYQGYSQISRRINGKRHTLFVHRLVCFKNRPDYDWQNHTEVRHAHGCEKRCINPMHLHPGTPMENSQDRVQYSNLVEVQ